MQLNLYVPKDQEAVVKALERVAREQGRAKNELVLDALREYLRGQNQPDSLGAYDLGAREPVRRANAYDERLDRQAAS